MLNSNGKKIFIIALLLLLIVSLSAVSAEDSASADTLSDDAVISNNAVADTATDLAISSSEGGGELDHINISDDTSSNSQINADVISSDNNENTNDIIDNDVSGDTSKKNILSSNKLEEDNVIYVSPYGPDDADGTMLKSYNTIQKALDSISGDGHYTIVLRSGNYTGAGNVNLTIDRDDLTIKASGKPAIAFDNGTYPYYLGWNITGSNINIEGIIFNTSRGYSSSFLRILNTENVNVSSCTFSNANYFNPFINVTDSGNVVIDNSKFDKLRTGYNNYIISSLRSNITVSNNDFKDDVDTPIYLSYSNANITGNKFDNVNASYIIYSQYSNSTISNNTFENIKNTNYNFYSPIYLNYNSNSTIVGNTFENINLSYSSSSHSPIYVYNGARANISDNDFINTYSNQGGAIYIATANNVVENNRFVNTSAYQGGAIYNDGTNLTLSNNTIEGASATYQGNKIFNNGGTLNNANVTFLNNESISTEAYTVEIPITVTDDMGNEIYGKTVSVKLNESSKGTFNVVDNDFNIVLSNSAEGTYLVNGSYVGALLSNVKTGVIEFLAPYRGPFYVATNGSDENRGDEDHPFATIEQAIKAAAVTNNTHAIYVKEGTYKESNLTISTGLNITGLGNVTIDADNKGRALYVTGSNVNISNINFINGNFSQSNPVYGGAVYWSGAKGTLNNASFENNFGYSTYYNSAYGGAVYWYGVNGTINNTHFKNNTIYSYASSSFGGAVYWSGKNGTIENSTFDDSEAITYSSSYSRYGGAVYWYGAYGSLKNNEFNNSTAYTGATIYNSAAYLTLSNNTINDPNGRFGKYIHAESYYSSINGVVVTILNNDTVETSSPTVDCLVTVTDDMGNPIYGGYINVTRNGTNVITGRAINENTTVSIPSPGIGEYLITPKYYHNSYADSYTAKTGVINWISEPYYGPFYVATNGSDANNGDEDHPFATIEQAIKAASMTNATPAIYVKEGTYKENDLNITKAMNITGIGNVTIDAEGQNDILNISANYVNITNLGFKNGNSSTDGGAIYWSGSYGKLENSSFVNNTADNRGGAIYNSGNYLKLTGNNITDCNASNGRSIYNVGSINGTTLILLNNDTVTLPEGVTGADVSVKLVDDMNNTIAGGYVNLTLNNLKIANMQNLTDDMVVTVYSPAYGEYLVNGSYRTIYYIYNTDYNNCTVETGVLTFLSEPYYGPYYVAENGSDYNDGSKDHPFATIEHAIEAASQVDVIPAIYINEGVYNESNLNITKPMNITGLGNAVINANGSSNIFNVNGSNVNVSNIVFENANKNGTGAAVTWSGVNGTLTNATFINNTANDAGALYWTGTNGTLVNSTFINNTAANRGGALIYVGNLNHTNNTFINNSAVNEGGAIFTNKTGLVNMANSTFVNNSARLGGAVFVDYNNQFASNLYNNSHFNILDSHFENNTAQDGGAVVLYASNSTIRNSTFIANNATRYGDGAISSGGENNTIINNTFINNTAFLYAGAIGSNSSKIINNTFINNSAYQGGAILTINDTIINNTFAGNNATIGKSIVYLQDYNLTNITCNCSLDDYECCDENCSCHDENFTGICNCTNHTVINRYSVLINNTLNDNEVFVYHGGPIMNVTMNFNGHYILSLDGSEELGADGYCIEMNNSMPWEINGTTGIAVNLSFIRNSLDASYVGDYIKVALILKESFQRWNIKELIFAFTDTDYLNSDDPDVQQIISIVNDPDTHLENGNNWIDGEWYCGDIYAVVHPTTRQNLIIINGCGDIDLPHLTPLKEANTTIVQEGDLVNFTISVTNDEEIYLHNVTVRDIPDSYLSFVGWNNTLKADGSPEDWIKDENKLIWRLNRTLLPGETVTFYAIFSASVPYNGIGNYTRDITNTINVTSYETNYDLAQDTVKGIRPYLVIRKDTLDTNVSVGDPVRFLITVTNIGEAEAREVHVYETNWAYPLSYMGWSNGFDNHTWYESSSYNWYLNEPLAPHESASLIVIFNATQSGTQFPNTALVFNPSGPTNSATNWTNVSYVYLAASKTVVNIEGELITFALTVTNVGCSTAYGAYISESNSYSFPLVNWMDSRGSYYNGRWSYSGPYPGSYFSSATWTLQDPLGPGGSATILLTLNTTYATGYSNSITVGDKQGSKNGTSTGGPIYRYLGAFKQVLEIKGETISFLLTVTNNGNVTAHDAYIYEYPSYMQSSFINWTDARGYSYNSDWYYNGNWNWTYRNPLGAGGSASIIVTFNTTSLTGYSNSIAVGEKNGHTNGTGTGGSLIRYLGAHKTVVNVKDDIITFLLTIKNNGNITAHNVELWDYLYDYGNGKTITFINWTDGKGSYYNDWTYRGSYKNGNYIYYNWTLNTPLQPGGSASVLVTFNTTNASGYSNSMGVREKNGFSNGTGTGDGLNRYLGAYKTVLDVKDDIIQFMLTVTNNGNITAHDVYIYDSVSDYGYGKTITLINWTDNRGSSYNNLWNTYFNGYKYNFTYKLPLGPGGTASVILTFNTTNASQYGNGITVGERNGFGNGTGTGDGLYRYLGAYKTVLEQKDDYIKYLLTVTNNGKITLHDVNLTDMLYHTYTYNNVTYNSNMSFIGWNDSKGSYYNSDWLYKGSTQYGSYTYYNWTFLKPLGPGGSASIVVVFNTSNATAFNNGMSVYDKTGYGNGTGLGGLINRSIGAYKTVVDIKDDIITFALTVSNNGNTTLTNVYIRESPGSPYMDFVKWEDARGSYYNSEWSYSGPSYGGSFTYANWYLSNPLLPGDSRTIFLTLNTTKAGGYNNGISTYADFAGNGTGLGGPLTRYLGAYKTVLELKDDYIVYMLTVSNNGNITAHDVYIQDTLSGGSMPLINWTDSRGSSYNGLWSYSGPSSGSFSSGTWTYKNPLGPGGSASIILKLNTTYSTSYGNGISVGERNGFGNGTGTGDGIFRYLGAYKLALDNNTNPDDLVRFRLIVTNHGNVSADQVFIYDKFGDFEMVSWNDSLGAQFNSNWAYEENNHRWVYQKVLTPGDSASIDVAFNVTKSGNFTNSMTVGDRFGGKNGTSVNVIVNSSLDVQKITLNDTVHKGNLTGFNITVTNNLDTEVTGVFVKEIIPEGLVYYGIEDESGNWVLVDEENYIFNYTDTLAPGEEASFIVLFNTTLSGNFTNVVVVGSNNTNNRSANNTTEVLDNPGLAVEKVTLNESVLKGELTGFNITVTNTGDCDLTGVYVVDTYPSELVYYNFTDDTAKWYYNDGTFIYNGTLESGDSTTFTIWFNTTEIGLFTNNVSAFSNRTEEETANNTTNVYYNPSLEVIKVTLNETVHKGELTEFNITVTNTGDSTLTGVYVKEQVPEGLVYVGFVDDTNMWYENNGTFIYNGTLVPEESATFTVIFNTTQTGRFTNVVVANSKETEKEEIAENNTTVTFNPDLTITKIANNESVYVGELISYTIIVNNTGEEDLTHVFIDEIIPDGLEYVSYENTSGNWFICKEKWVYDGTLKVGESAELTIFFNTTKAGQVNNTVIGGSDYTNNTTADNNTTVVYKPELNVEKITNNNIVYNGNTVEFTIKVTNVGDCPIDSPFVVENVPEGLVYVNYIDESGKWTFDEETYTWTYDGVLDSEESAEFVIVFNTTQSGEFTNIVIAGSNITINVTANNSTVVYTPTIEVEKLANDEFVYNGNTTSYIIKVVNTGDCDVTGVKVTENIPENVVYLSYESKVGTWTFDESTYTWTLDGALAAGESAEFVIVFNTTQSGVINNTVVAESNETINQTAVNNTTIVYTPSLEVEKVALNETVNKGQLAQFMIIVRNTGDCDIEKVFVEDSWPDGLIAVGFIDDSNKWFNNGAHWIYNGVLKSGESANFTVVFFANESANFTNVAVAGSNITGNVTDNATVEVLNPAVDIKKTANDDIVYVGNTTSYTITITNTGNTNLTDIIINELAPEDLIYVEYINKTGKWIYDGTLQPGEVAEFIVIYNTTKSGRIDNKILLESGETPNSTTHNNTTVVYSPSLEVEKRTNNETVFNGNLTEFTIVVRNTGDCNLTEVYVQEEIPEGLVYVDYKDDSGKWSYDGESKKFTYDGELAVNETAEFVVVFNTTKSGEFDNKVTAGSNITGNTTSNNKTTVFTPSLVAQKITLNKTVYSGEKTEFLIIVTNNGDCNLTNIVVEEVIPKGLSYYTFNDPTGKWVNEGTKWTYTESLAPGESVNFTVICDTKELGNFTNTIIVSSNETGPVNATNTTEVVNKTVPANNTNDTPKHMDTPATGLAKIKSGNPLVALILVLIVLGLSPLRRKRE